MRTLFTLVMFMAIFITNCVYGKTDSLTGANVNPIITNDSLLTIPQLQTSTDSATPTPSMPAFSFVDAPGIASTHAGSVVEMSFENKNTIRNPYKLRNIGIGFLAGGALNAAVGIHFIEKNKHDDYFGIATVFGAGAVLVGSSSIIAGTICTIIGSVRGYKYTKAHSSIRVQPKGNGLALSYNF